MNYRNQRRKNEQVAIRLPDGTFIKRVPKVTQMGNFQMMTIIYNNAQYIIGVGDEYLRGMPEYFELGKKLESHERIVKRKEW